MLSLNLTEGALSELLHGDDLVLMSETIMGLRNMFIIWMVSFYSYGVKANLGKTKVMVNGGITHNGLSESNVGPFGVYSLRVKADSVLCFQCGRWIHGRCARVKRLTQKI